MRKTNKRETNEIVWDTNRWTKKKLDDRKRTMAQSIYTFFWNAFLDILSSSVATCSRTTITPCQSVRSYSWTSSWPFLTYGKGSSSHVGQVSVWRWAIQGSYVTTPSFRVRWPGKSDEAKHLTDKINSCFVFQENTQVFKNLSANFSNSLAVRLRSHLPWSVQNFRTKFPRALSSFT